jgi:hypothetical protein
MTFDFFPGFWEHRRCKYSAVDVGDAGQDQWHYQWQDEFNIFEQNSDGADC